MLLLMIVTTEAMFADDCMTNTGHEARSCRTGGTAVATLGILGKDVIVMLMCFVSLSHMSLFRLLRSILLFDLLV